MTELPLRMTFVPRQFFDLGELKEYILIGVDHNNKIRCWTNTTDPIRAAGLKEVFNICFRNTFLKIETTLNEPGNQQS